MRVQGHCPFSSLELLLPVDLTYKYILSPSLSSATASFQDTINDLLGNWINLLNDLATDVAYNSQREP